MGKLREYVIILVFVLLCAAFALLCSFLFSSTITMMGGEAQRLSLTMARVGQLLGVLGFVIIWYKSASVFSEFGLSGASLIRILPLLLIGAFLGFGLQSLIFYGFSFSGNSAASVIDVMYWVSVVFLPAILMHTCVALSEELLFRGVVLSRLAAAANPASAILVQAVVFSLFHSFNNGFNVYAFFGLLMFGLAAALLRVVTGSLWCSVAFHSAWNVSQGSVFGFAVSGEPEQASLFRTAWSGDPIWTGGDFGPEAGLLSMLALTGLTIILAALRLKKRLSVSYPLR